MYKAKYSDIKLIIEHTNWNYKAFAKGEHPYTRDLASYAPSNANWSYRLGIALGADGNVYEVVTAFGGVEGYRYLLDTKAVV